MSKYIVPPKSSEKELIKNHSTKVFMRKLVCLLDKEWNLMRKKIHIKMRLLKYTLLSTFYIEKETKNISINSNIDQAINFNFNVFIVHMNAYCTCITLVLKIWQQFHHLKQIFLLSLNRSQEISQDFTFEI